MSENTMKRSGGDGCYNSSNDREDSRTEKCRFGINRCRTGSKKYRTGSKERRTGSEKYRSGNEKCRTVTRNGR